MRWPSVSDIHLAIKFYFKARTRYDAHSPFFYRFINNVLDTDKEYYVFEDIENLRSKLLRIHKKVAYQELGAGSKTGHNTERSISEIARTSSTSSIDGRILFNLAIHCHARCILELGTSLGIGTAYMASASGTCEVHTLEGNPASAYVAKRNFELLGLDNIHLHEGEFSATLPGVLETLKKIDMVYIDGNHTYDGTIEYFHKILPFLSGKGVVVLDDIYWSGEMNQAWEDLRIDPKVTASINTYSKGFLFFDPQIKTENKHFTFISTRFKPWRMGLFS